MRYVPYLSKYCRRSGCVFRGSLYYCVARGITLGALSFAVLPNLAWNVWDLIQTKHSIPSTKLSTPIAHLEIHCRSDFDPNSCNISLKKILMGDPTIGHHRSHWSTNDQKTPSMKNHSVRNSMSTQKSMSGFCTRLCQSPRATEPVSRRCWGQIRV